MNPCHINCIIKICTISYYMTDSKDIDCAKLHVAFNMYRGGVPPPGPIINWSTVQIKQVVLCTNLNHISSPGIFSHFYRNHFACVYSVFIVLFIVHVHLTVLSLAIPILSAPDSTYGSARSTLLCFMGCLRGLNISYVALTSLTDKS